MTASENQSTILISKVLRVAEPTYYDRIPAILDHLTFIYHDKESGKWYRKRLSPTTKEVYRILKQRAGKENKCWRSVETLADQVGCSRDCIIKAKRELSESFEQLEGLPLISIEVRRTRTTRNDKSINTKEIHIITIEHIWAYNDEFMSAGEKPFVPMKQEISEHEAMIAIEKMRQPSIKDVVHNQGAESESRPSRNSGVEKSTLPPRGHSRKVDSKQITDYTALKTDYTAKAAPASFIEEDLLNSLSNNESAAAWLNRFGCDSNFIKWITQNFSLCDLNKSVFYLIDCMKKKRVPNPQGYLRKILNERLFEKVAYV